MSDFTDLIQNKFFVGTLSSWFIAQVIKVIINTITHKRLDFQWFVDTGGMPSSHTSSVTTLAALIGIELGFGTPLFAMSLLFAIITMTDAAGVRRAAGEQAAILNRIMDDVSHHKKIQREKLRELLGHSPIEVFVGIALGIIMALLFLGY